MKAYFCKLNKLIAFDLYFIPEDGRIDDQNVNKLRK